MLLATHGCSKFLVGLLLFAVIGLLAIPAAASEADGSNDDGLRDLSIESSSEVQYPAPFELDGSEIYGGSEVVNPGWIVALFEGGSFICTASLIDPLVVLTAAHCVDTPGSYSVLVGEEYLYGSGVTRTVTDVYVHPGWGGNFNDTDLALLALDSPVTSLPVATLNTTGAWPEFTQSLVVAGWGQYYDGSPASSYLLAGGVFATSGMDGSYDELWCDLDPSAMTVGGMFCIGGPLETEVSTCPGDSGGPVIGWSTPTTGDGDLAIYGLVSYGPSYCGWNYWDDKAQSVGDHHDWIESVVAVVNDPFIATGTESVVLYDSASSRAFVRDVRATGTGFTSPANSGTVGASDTVGTAYLGGPDTGVDDVLFYSSVTGRFQFASVTDPNASGRRFLSVFVDVTGTRNWTHVITGDYNGDNRGDVLFYRATDGLLRFYTTSASGKFTPLTPAYYGTRGWTHLVVGDYNADGSDDVMWYRARDGLLRFYEVTDTGEFRAITPAYFGTRNWSEIPSGDYDGNGSDDVLFYRGDGIARFYEVDASGTFRALGVAFNPSPGFTQIEAAELTPGTPGVDLVWYHDGHDLLAATRYATNNVANLWDPQGTADAGDSLVMSTGTFSR